MKDQPFNVHGPVSVVNLSTELKQAWSFSLLHEGTTGRVFREILSALVFDAIKVR